MAALAARCSQLPPAQQDVWRLMDEVWDELGCDVGGGLVPDRLGAFYGHAVWLLNGLFIEEDAVSLGNRRAIVDAIRSRSGEISAVLDYGGGCGGLGRMLAAACPTVRVDIFEPHPFQYALDLAGKFPSLEYVERLNGPYDCITAVDVLEHVPDPLGLLAQLASSLRIGGLMIAANCFHPVIKCHLPSTFHLRFTYSFFARTLGLEEVGSCDGTYARLFVKRRDAPPPGTHGWRAMRSWEKLSRRVYHAVSPLIRLLDGALT